MNISIVKYKNEYYELWNNFVQKAVNGTFLFHRDFMEYHSDRFEDASRLIFNEEKLVAVFPANIMDKTIYSHLGLSYGGFVISSTTKTSHIFSYFEMLLSDFNKEQVDNVVVKILPRIYEDKYNDALLYGMIKLEANLIKRELLSVVDLNSELNLSRDRKAGIKRGIKNGLVVKEVSHFETFWNDILIPNLYLKHNVKPVHSLSEIKYLKSKFPSNIRQFNVYHNNDLVAGTTIFETKYVAHSQYISAKQNKNKLGSLDFLHYHLLTKIFSKKHYFDFGNSHENNSQNINEGILYWKEGFGARPLAQDFYQLTTCNHALLNNIMV